MCGIFGLVGSEKAPEITFKGLLDIEYRGYDSWGIAYPSNNSFEILKKIGFLPKSIKVKNAKVAIGHTRWATHGGVTEENAHPHTDCTGQLVMVHNGIVENYLSLKEGLKSHKFKSNTDSEIIAHLIEEEYAKTNDLKLSVSHVFKKLEGLNAIVVTDGNRIVACKAGSPLVAGISKQNGFLIASDPNAILPYTNELLFLEDNQLVDMNSKLELFDALTLQRLDSTSTKVDWSHKKADLQEYPHFMLKEINEQPEVLRSIIKNEKAIKQTSELVKKAYGSFFIACGSAAYTAMEGVYLFSKFAKKHVNFSVGSEFNYIQDYLTPKSLLIAISQSGESIDTLEPVIEAKKRGVKVVSLVNVLGSSLYRISDYPLLLQTGVEKAVASTKAVTAMLAYMILLAFYASSKEEEAKKIILKSASEVESVITRQNQISELAEIIKDKEHIFTLGRGCSYPVALESSLKIKEISYIHSEGLAGGELKHGVIAMIEAGTPVICYVPNDETKDAMLANAMEVKSRGAYVIGIAPENNPVFDFFFQVSDVGASSIIPNVVFAQLLGYFLATKRGKNPDKPRNLAKSVVVR